jgi:methanogenic corrinoid protein MtbC1/predicted DNA-binding transcriptional regulator AlpA
MFKESNTNNKTPVFNIKAVVKQTGLNPATIRAWERRYGFPSPRRTEGGHRQYSQRDIDTLNWLIARQDEGMSISHAIELWRSYVEKGGDPLESMMMVTLEPVARPAFPVAGQRIEELRQAWISACLDFDREKAEQVLAQAFALFSPNVVCIEVLQKGLAEIGGGWYEGQVTIQQEHFASALSVQRLETLIAAAPPPTRPERIIVATAPGDYHIFSPLLLTYLLRRQGWDVIYLGADVPAAELESTVEHVQPAIVVISAQLLHTAAALKEVASTLQDLNIMLGFGGLVFNQMPELRQLIPGHFLGQTLEGAIQRISEMIAGRPPLLHQVGSLEIYHKALAQYMERRSLLESHIWGTFVATNKSTDHLADINDDMAEMIIAALKLGDASLLQADINWIEHLLMGYRLPKEWIHDYVLAYYQSAKIHLGHSASMIVDWLSQLVGEQSRLPAKAFLEV